jgi:hypothetical protein
MATYRRLIAAPLVTLATVSMLCTLAGWLAFVSPAFALFTHVYSGRSFGPSGTGSGAFGDIQGIAVDQSSQDVYVYDAEGGASGGGAIYRFNSMGEPADFEWGTNVITTGRQLIELKGYAEMAVDNSCFLRKLSGPACESADPANGDIYLANSSSEGVGIYNSEGESLGILSGGEDVGVAVDSTGDVYVALYEPGIVAKYTPVNNPVTNADYTSALFHLNFVSNIVVDSTGAVYAATEHLEPSRGCGRCTFPSPVTKYEASQFNTQEEAAVNAQDGEVGRTFEIGRTFAMDLLGGGLYVDSASSISRYTPAGELLETLGAAAPPGEAERPGTLKESFGVAVNATAGSSASGDVYAADATTLDKTYGHEAYRVNIYSQGVAFGPPLVSTGAAQDPARASVQLQGTVNPAGPETSYRFEYIDEAGYQAALAQGASDPYAVGASATPGGSTTAVDVGAGGNVDAVASEAGELQPETTYHYRIAATNADGTSYGADQTFTTAPRTPPLVVTGGASAVSQNAATISGTIDSQGLQTTYGFEIGTEAGEYGPPTGLGSVGAGVSEAAGSLALTGLQPGTTYRYRITASNVDGTSLGADRTFTTTVYPSTFAEPPSPLPFVAVPAIAFPPEVERPAKTTRKPHRRSAHRAHRKKGKRKKG